MTLKRQLMSPSGNRVQAGVLDAKDSDKFVHMAPILRLGTVYSVNTFDTALPNNPLSPNRVGKYITYDVILNPLGVIVRDVPALGSSGYYNNTLVPNSSESSTTNVYENSDETPYYAGQPVLIGTIENSNLNLVIIGGFPCQLNSGSQTAAEYPQKQGSFQGTSYKIDKNGNPTLNIVASGNLHVQINGVPFLTIDGSTNTVDLGPTASHVNLGAAVEPTVLGNTLNTYLSNFINTVFNLHTHQVISTGAPTLTPTPLGTPPSGITTTVVKVS